MMTSVHAQSIHPRTTPLHFALQKSWPASDAAFGGMLYGVTVSGTCGPDLLASGHEEDGAVGKDTVVVKHKSFNLLEPLLERAGGGRIHGGAKMRLVRMRCNAASSACFAVPPARAAVCCVKVFLSFRAAGPDTVLRALPFRALSTLSSTRGASMLSVSWCVSR